MVLPSVAVLTILTVGAVVSIDLSAAEKTAIALSVSAPANGSHFVVGEKAVATVTLPAGVSRSDLSTLGLYLYGPQETTQTKAAVKLLNASTDRAARPHHYIDLLTNPAVVVNGSVLTYELQAVSDEAPGTYTASLRFVSKSDPLDQAMLLSNLQIGTATVETQIVDKDKCAKCHLGADSGQFYFAHVDPSSPGATGSPSLESWPVRTCKSCHNTDGYAAYRDPQDATVRVPDAIVRRVHGIHMGGHLKNPRNIDPATGIFRDYTEVVFPADVKNCTTCHSDDRWKTTPSRLACGSCHDNTWFGAPAGMPATGELHKGGQQSDDTNCSSCHPADGNWIKGIPPVPIATAHKVSLGTKFTVELAMTAPANGTHYVGGETPQIAITIKNTVGGAIVDPATITEATWNRLRLQVSGPRLHTGPVLTTAAADRAFSGSTSYVYNDLRVRTDPAKADPKITRSATAITYQLADVAAVQAGTYTVFVQGANATETASVGVLNFQVGMKDEEKKVATNCGDCHADTKMHGAYPFDPDVCKSCHDYENQLTGKTGWKDSNWGFGAAPLARRIHGVHFGHYLDKPSEVHKSYDYSGVIFPQDIRNCTKCHADNPVWKQAPSRLGCLSCHDSDEAIYHGTLMTFDITSDAPYNGDEVETCTVCHGAEAAFSPDTVHNISDPYQPPYPREGK
jgi:hypothetical protein